MSNQFISLAVPVGNGVGAATDVSTFGASKTIVVAGDAQAQITVEFNNDAAQAGSWTPIRTFQNSGEFTTSVACKWMRVHVAAYNVNKGGTSEVSVGGTTEGASFAALASPAASGVGGSVDTSALGPFKTVQVGGRFRGTTIIEVSEDGGVTWSQPFSFGSQSPGAQSRVIAADFMRVRRVGVPKVDPGLPVVNVGATASAGGGGGGLGVDVENEGAPIAGNPHTTLDFVGAGVTAADAGGGVATITIPGGITGEDEGVPVAGNPHGTLNFAGAGVIASDAGGGVLLITIPGGGGIAGVNIADDGVPLVGNPYTSINFAAGLTAVDVAGVATISAPGLAGNTPGSVLFAGPAGTPDQDNANFFYNSATHRLGIGNAAPTTPLDVTGTTRTTNLAITALTLGSLLFMGAAGAVLQDNANAFYDVATHRLGLGNAAPTTTLDVTGIATAQSVNVANAGAGFYASADGASAGVSAANTGRLRYNNTAKKWQLSVDTGAYIDIVSGTGAGMAIGNTVTSGTTGSVLYVAAGPVLAQDNANFFWDGTAHRLGIGNAAPGTPLDVTGVARATNVTISAMTLGSALFAGTAGAVTQDNANYFYDATNHRLGLGNAAPSTTLDVTGVATAQSVNVANAGSAFYASADGASSAVSAANTGRLRYNNSTKTWQVSMDTAAYVNVATGTAGMAIGGTVTSGTTGSVLFVGAGPVLAQDNANYFWDVGNHRLGLGNAAPATTLDVTGIATAQSMNVSAAGSAFYASADGASAAVSAASTGRLRYNNTAKKWQVSIDTGAYADIVSGTGTGMAIGNTVTSGTANSILFVGTGPVLAQDNTNFVWDNTNKILSLNGTTTDYGIKLLGGPAFSLMKFRNTNTAGASGFDLFDSSDTQKAALAYGNSTFGTTRFRLKTFLFSNVDVLFDNGTNTAVAMGMTNGSSYIEMGTGATAAVSAGSTIRFRYDQTGGAGVGAYQISVNTAAYKGMAITEATSWGSGEQQAILFSNTSNRIATDKSNLFWDTTNARMGVGTQTTTTTTQRVQIVGTGTADSETLKLMAGGTSSYATTSLFNSAGTQKGACGYGTTGVTTTVLRDVNFLFAPTGTHWVMSDGNAVLAKFYYSTNGFGMELADGGPSATVSGSGLGKIRYNNTTKTFQVSVDGGAYVSLVTL